MILVMTDPFLTSKDPGKYLKKSAANTLAFLARLPFYSMPAIQDGPSIIKRRCLCEQAVKMHTTSLVSQINGIAPETRFILRARDGCRAGLAMGSLIQ